MRYKVKNTVTGEETICEKVVVDGFNYYLSNDEIKDETHYISWEKDYATEPKERYVLYVKSTGLNGETPRKVIATTNKSLGLPMVIDEVKELAENEHKYNHKSVQEIGFRLGFEMGYKQAKETYSYTKEDMVEFTDWIFVESFKRGTSDYTTSELLDIWQEQRTIEILVK